MKDTPIPLLPMILLVVGTRPECIKVGPVVAELRALGADFEVLLSGQHTDLLAGTPAETDLADADTLSLPSSGNVDEWIETALPIFAAEFSRRKPRTVVVQGDTMSAYAAARSAFQLGIPIAHIEAGVRSHDLDEPWPEEWIRREISQLATHHFAATKNAVLNLADEDLTDNVHLTGNPVVSALERYGKAFHVAHPFPQILVTMHRREWLALGTESVKLTYLAFREEAEVRPGIMFKWPMHPATAKALDLKKGPLPDLPNFKIVAPMHYREAVTQLSRSMGVATDSGGIQEEAATIGVPCAVMRRTTDRPESVQEGVARTFCPTPDGVHRAVKCLCERRIPRKPSAVYGRPDSARKIAEILQNIATGAILR